MSSNANTSESWGSIIGGLIVLFFFGWLIVAYVFPDNWQIKYAILYLAPYTQVQIVDRPTSCDFLRAPIGQKACHVEKVVATVRWRKSEDGKSMVSYDEGQSWSVGTPQPNVQPPTTFVYVSWTKKDDP